MTRLRWLIVLAFAAGCGDPPPFALKFRITPNETQKCIAPDHTQATTCAEVTMACDAVVSIRIVPPDDLTAPYISLCKPLPRRDVCGIAGVDLPQPVVPVPQQRLLVQMAVYPKFRLPIDVLTGQPRCPPPASVEYGADGFPVTQEPPCDENVTDPDLAEFCWPTPAIGGTAYYTPGDDKTVVDLGCSNIDEFMDPMCLGEQTTAVTATVSDFDTPGLSVSENVANIVGISIGEPQASGGEFVLDFADVASLARASIVPPSWAADVKVKLVQSACLEVSEETPQSTITIACEKLPSTAPHVDINGVRMAKQTLDQIVKAIKDVTPAFTLDQGLVVGLVLDSLGNPMANHAVSIDTSGTIEYLSSDRTRFVAGGTSTSGIFLSRDTPYRTTFSTTAGPGDDVSGYGGLVHGKVTIIVLQLPQPTSGG